MLKKLDELYLMGKMKLATASEEFLSEEKGASHLVEIIVVIVIIVALAGVFKEQLKGAITAIFTNLTNFINNSENKPI